MLCYGSMAKSAGVRRSEGLRDRRVKAAVLFAKGATQAEVARELGVSRVSALRWYLQWRRGGRERLAKAGRLGRPRRLSASQLKRVEQVLLKGAVCQGYSTDLWTLPRIATVIGKVTGVRYHPGHVWRVLQALGWSLQRPARRARERDEEAIRRWKRVRWPQVKKTSARAEA